MRAQDNTEGVARPIVVRLFCAQRVVQANDVMCFCWVAVDNAWESATRASKTLPVGLQRYR